VKDKITIYGTDECKFCHLAKQLSESKGMETEYIDAAADMVAFSKLFPNARTVPQILLGDTWIGGYSDLKEVLESVE
jgi:glutaredoxin